MALLNILQFPDPRLKTVAEPVTEFTPELKQIVADMFETMYESQGIGLAATQVNIHQRIIVMDMANNGSEQMCLINPEFVERTGEITWKEGCLSFPGVFANVKRYARVVITYQDVEGQPQTLEAEGLLAVCIQHEIDHIDGITFYDHLSGIKQRLMRDKLKKIREKSL